MTLRDYSTVQQRREGLLRLRDDVVNDCRGREDSEATDQLLRQAETLDRCASSLAAGALGLDGAECREASR